jgi:hypothetical protein
VIRQILEHLKSNRKLPRQTDTSKLERLACC